MRLAIALATAALAVAPPAQAEWRKASSDHFVVYADDSEKDVRRFTEMLERYHNAMEILTGREVVAPSPSNRLTIFAVGSQSQMARLVGNPNTAVAGFYVPRAGASRAFVQDIELSTYEIPWTLAVLMHEYAHHFLISSSRFWTPAWLREGSAEFYAASRFPRDGSVEIGKPAYHRGAELRYFDDISIEQIVAFESLDEDEQADLRGFYGWSWALLHFLTFEEARAGQLQTYRRLLEGGTGSLDAAKQAFGDLDRLERELRSYKARNELNGFSITADLVTPGPIEIVGLSVGEAAAMDVRIWSEGSWGDEQTDKILESARKVAGRFPDDPAVNAMLAEAEFDAGNDAEAIAAADRAITADPGQVNAYIQKGYALFRMADALEEGPERVRAFTDAMAPFAALNRLENDHPLPLVHYYRSAVETGAITENARAAIENAAMLAPFDQALWLTVSAMQLGEGKIELARSNLRPIAFSPHDGPLPEAARKMLAFAENAEEGLPMDVSGLPDLEELNRADADGDDDTEDEGESGGNGEG